MCRLLFSGRGRDKEVGIEALWHALWCNPVGEVPEAVGRQSQVFGMGHIYQGALALIECLAITVKTSYVILADCQYLLAAIGKEDTGFLKKFTDGGRSDAAAQESSTFGVCSAR